MTHERIPVATLPEPLPLVARIGLLMRAHPRAITALQVMTVLVYLLLLVLPVFEPLPGDDDGILDNLTRFAQFVFWGLWWPGVILAVLLLGRFWCGVLCPEGALSEWASRIGAGRGIPGWMKWSWWPLVAFLGTTVFGQLVSVYEYPQAALLVLGGSTVAAILVGLLYGRGKRVWCRHLCPVNGVFGLLSRFSVLQFRVDRARWESAPPGGRARVNCAPMIDIRRMDSMAKCHACGRCAGQREAVTLAWRAPGSEALANPPPHTPATEAMLLLYGMIGVAMGAFQWSASPWFVAMKQAIAEWLVWHDIFWPLADNAPWWLLTHHEAANDVFTWLDGFLIVAYICATGIVIGSVLVLLCDGAARLVGDPSRRWSIAMAFTPLAAAGLLLGLTMTTVTQLAAEGVAFTHMAYLRLLVLGIGALWSMTIAARLTTVDGQPGLHAASLPITGILLVCGFWMVQFFVW